MFLICSSFLFSAKFYDQPYTRVSDDLKKLIRNSMTSLKSMYNLSNQDISLLETLIKLIEVIDETVTIRKSLIRLRNELELWRTDDNLPQQRKQLIDLTIDVINIIHYGTFYCTSFEKLILKSDILKMSLKEMRETNKSSMHKIDEIYISYLYKIPTLIVVKRGLYDELRKRREAKSENSNELSNEANNDPDL